jgi:NAD(P)-dependent dehydrogenase (short-subunit alcohol dehydrogenase family)
VNGARIRALRHAREIVDDMRWRGMTVPAVYTSMTEEFQALVRSGARAAHDRVLPGAAVSSAGVESAPGAAFVAGDGLRPFAGSPPPQAATGLAGHHLGNARTGSDDHRRADDIADRAVLVTGANRGIGQALVAKALRSGARRVYAGTRQPLAHPDGRVTPLTLDITNAAQTQAAAERVESLDLLINNAGLALYEDLSDPATLERHLAVNLFGTYGVPQAFLPLLTGSRDAIVNLLSIAAFAPIPVMPAYSISKAAAFNLTQSLRALLAGRGVRVHAVLAGPVDTEMVPNLDIPKTAPESVARAIVDGVERGEEEIFPDPMSASMAESWRRGAAKALERQNAAPLAAAPVKA